jgi:hypothetical protein
MYTEMADVYSFAMVRYKIYWRALCNDQPVCLRLGYVRVSDRQRAVCRRAIAATRWQSTRRLISFRSFAFEN